MPDSLSQAEQGAPASARHRKWKGSAKYPLGKRPPANRHPLDLLTIRLLAKWDPSGNSADERAVVHLAVGHKMRWWEFDRSQVEATASIGHLVCCVLCVPFAGIASLIIGMALSGFFVGYVPLWPPRDNNTAVSADTL